MEPELLDMSSTAAKKTIKLFTSSFLQRYRSQLERLLPDERRPDHAGQDSIAKPPRKGLSGGDTKDRVRWPNIVRGAFLARRTGFAYSSESQPFLSRPRIYLLRNLSARRSAP